LEIEDWAFRQMCAKLGPAVYGKGSNKGLPAEYLQAIPADLRATVLNRHVKVDLGKTWMARGYDGDCRAILSGDYARVSNAAVLEAVQAIIEKEAHNFPGLQWVRPSVTRDDLNLKIVWHTPGNGNYGIGTYIGNGETGNRKYRVLPMIQRHSCTNSLIFDQEMEGGVVGIHRGSVKTIMTLIKASLVNVFHLSAEAMDRIIEAEATELPDLAEVMAGIGRKFGWDEAILNHALMGTENQNTVAGLANGISFAAHAAVEDPNQQVDMETLAGSVLLWPVQRLHALASSS
jgi:hypothetical protein